MSRKSQRDELVARVARRKRERSRLVTLLGGDAAPIAVASLSELLMQAIGASHAVPTLGAACSGARGGSERHHSQGEVSRTNVTEAESGGWSPEKRPGHAGRQDSQLAAGSAQPEGALWRVFQDDVVVLKGGRHLSREEDLSRCAAAHWLSSGCEQSPSVRDAVPLWQDPSRPELCGPPEGREFRTSVFDPIEVPPPEIKSSGGGHFSDSDGEPEFWLFT